jgi:regulator of sirC expression with transglutaminase-like and TPR domain
MPNTTLSALLNLLDEPDERAFQVIREQILLQGTGAMSALENSLDNTFDSVVRERIQGIIRKMQQDDLLQEFTNWMNIGSSDLLQGFILVTKTAYPSLDARSIIIAVEQLKVDIWIELNENLTALENVKVLNHILFDIHHFDGNRNDMTAPRNNYINSLLETKLGSPLSMGMLFIILAQKLGLPLHGVNLPQHFILAYLTEPGLENPGEDDVLFYINPFNKGAVFTRREIELFVGQMKIKPDTSYFAPCSNTEIIRRLINNLIFSYSRTGNTEMIEDLENLLNAFS